jgi:hypothetical protein
MRVIHAVDALFQKPMNKYLKHRSPKDEIAVILHKPTRRVNLESVSWVIKQPKVIALNLL